MALTTIEPVGNFPAMPTIVPRTSPKSAGFTFLPAGTIRQYSAKKWGMYYCARENTTFIVVDAGKDWSIRPVIGKMKLTMAQGVMSTKPCCQED